MADTMNDGWEDVFGGVFEIKLNTTDSTEPPSTCRADKLEKENESLYKLVDDLRDKLAKQEEKHADEIKYWKKVAEELSKALVERQGVTDNSVVPFLRRLQAAFNKSVLGSEEVEDHFDAYTALSNLSNIFSEIYCMIDIRLPEDAIFRTIDKFLHEATKNYVENFTLRKEHDTEEDE